MNYLKAVICTVCLIMLMYLSNCGRESRKEVEAEQVILKSASLKVISPVSIPVRYQAVGTVKSKTSSQIASKIMGNILTIKVKEGVKVKKGDVLIILESNEL